MAPAPINPLKAKLEAGEVALGVLVTMPSVALAQTLAAAGLDWLFIDREHGPIGLESIHAMIAATAGHACAPIVRVPSTDPAAVKPILDSGAMGVIFPLIAERADAERSVAAVRYPPAGARGFGPFHAPNRWGLSREAYLAAANREILNILLIETAAAIENLDAILAVEGVDAAMIAPFDLAQSLGVSGQIDHPKMRAAVRFAERRILASDRTLGSIAASPAHARRLIRKGHRLILLGYDVALIQAMIEDLRAAILR